MKECTFQPNKEKLETYTVEEEKKGLYFQKERTISAVKIKTKRVKDKTH